MRMRTCEKYFLGTLLSIAVALGVMICIKVSDPSFQERLRQEEHQLDSIMKAEAFCKDSFRKSETQIQPKKTMETEHIDKNSGIAAKKIVGVFFIATVLAFGLGSAKL